MMGLRLWVVGAFFALGLGIGCSKKDEAPALARGGLGESCTRRADCTSNLLCINQVCQPTADGQVEDPTPLGGVGESCTRRSDCAMGLVCVSNVCAESSAAIVSAEGETCGARSDCAEGLRCFANVCATQGGGEASAGRGESCRTTDDCDDPLICLGQSCVEGDFDIERTDSECLQVQCEEPADCCPEPYEYCDTWRMECEMGTGGANSVSCESYENPVYNCICDSSVWSCDNYQCGAEVTCESDLDCTFGVCDPGGVCVTCVEDADCLVAGQQCVENACTGACLTDTECPVFHSCEEGACVDTGCKDDRECIAYTGSPLAVCAEGVCEEPCERDADCLVLPQTAAFGFSACVEGFCQDVGCKTDEECKIRLNLAGSTVLEALCLLRVTEP